MPLLFAPTIGAALAARTTQLNDPRKVDRRPDAAVNSLIPSRSCNLASGREADIARPPEIVRSRPRATTCN
jgi:hypothetical protein